MRNRIEYRLADSTKSFRNRTKIALQSRNEILRLKPFIANEFYYDFDEDKYNKNTSSIGFAMPRKSFGEVSIYYKYKMDLEDNGDWSSSDTVIAKLSYDF
ncbi:MAG: hypothetical protein HOM96_01205 [Rickettsiales bacterium]|nr:hypothetical protein [Rickettsiales bacterium]